MWDPIRIGRFQPGRSGDGNGSRAGRRSNRHLLLESLEERRLLATAPTGPSLAPISNQTVPAQQGLTLPLDGSGTTDDQTFTVTSSNPDIVASVPAGPPSSTGAATAPEFLTLNITYTDPTNSANDFSGPLVFELFGNVTPNTVKMIEQFVTDGYYTSKDITRVATGFPGSTNYIIQGGAPNSNGTGNSGQPGTPFNNENDQQLAFSGTDQLAMANAGVNTNDTQFFVTTTGSPNSELGYSYTIFGQMIPNPTSSGEVSDQTTLTKLTQIPVTENTNLNEDSLPVYPPVITSATLSTAYPSGALVLDASQAKAGETGTITVTATDTATGQTTSQQFTATVGSYSGPTDPQINFKPYANATTANVTAGSSGTVTLQGTQGYPATTTPGTLTYSLVSQPADGTVSNFNPNTGTFTYTPKAGFTGNDTFQYQVTQSVPNNPAITSGPEGVPESTTSNAGTVTVTVAPIQPVDTGAVRLDGTVLLITPLPSVNHNTTNYIDVIQTTTAASPTTPVIQVYVNNQLDLTQPQTSNIDSIVAFGSKANDRITIDPTVTVPAYLDGGHGGINVLKAGESLETREHGWFGYNLLVGGSGPNQLIGLAGHVRFKPSKTTDLIFAGQPKPRTPLLHATPPGGTFYVYKDGRLIAVPLSDVIARRSTTDLSSADVRRKK